MASSTRYWPRVGKTAFVLATVYMIAMSFWCSAAGKAHKELVVEQDKIMHHAAAQLQGVRERLQGQGVQDFAAHPEYAVVAQRVDKLASETEAKSKASFTGIDAMRMTLIVGVAWLGVYFMGAALIWQSKRKPARTSVALDS